MKAIDKMVEWLEKGGMGTALFTKEIVLAKARRLAAEEADNEDKHKADKGLIFELSEWLVCCGGCMPTERKDELYLILSRYTDDKPKEESLAELAARKGFYKTEMYSPDIDDKEWVWFAYNYNGMNIDDKPIKAPTHQECEAKARLWLEKQGDK